MWQNVFSEVSNKIPALTELKIIKMWFAEHVMKNLTTNSAGWTISPYQCCSYERELLRKNEEAEKALRKQEELRKAERQHHEYFHLTWIPRDQVSNG